LSRGKTVTASSIEGRAFSAQAAVDGDTSTRWSSAFSDPQWLQVDLGSSTAVDRVVLNWERAYATAFQIQVSDDATTWTSVYTTTAGAGGTQTIPVGTKARFVRMYGTARSTGYGYSLWEFQVFGTPSGSGAPASATAPASAPATTGTSPTAGGSPTGTSAAGWIMAPNPVTNVKPSHNIPPDKGGFHEFQANCSVSRTNVGDDPIVYPNQPGASHLHTFMGNTTISAASTIESLSAGQTTCKAKGDLSAYWMPTLYNGATAVHPVGNQVIYYKSGVIDYTSVRPFPPGLRFLVGSPAATLDEFRNNPGTVEGWECGDSAFNWDFPATCTPGSLLNVRLQAPSCWDGLHLDTPDHKSHMAYPVLGVCPNDHPVAVPMIEFKMAFPVSGDMSQVRLSSGRGYSFHYDFFNAWDVPTLAALSNHCINGGLQCDPRGFDQYKPDRGAVLNENYVLP
jgi:hypothetical protein